MLSPCDSFGQCIRKHFFYFYLLVRNNKALTELLVYLYEWNSNQRLTSCCYQKYPRSWRAKHRWYYCHALAVTAIAVQRTIATAIDIRLDCGW